MHTCCYQLIALCKANAKGLFTYWQQIYNKIIKIIIISYIYETDIQKMQSVLLSTKVFLIDNKSIAYGFIGQ